MTTAPTSTSGTGVTGKIPLQPRHIGSPYMANCIVFVTSRTVPTIYILVQMCFFMQICAYNIFIRIFVHFQLNIVGCFQILYTCKWKNVLFVVSICLFVRAAPNVQLVWEGWLFRIQRFVIFNLIAKYILVPSLLPGVPGCASPAFSSLASSQKSDANQHDAKPTVVIPPK